VLGVGSETQAALGSSATGRPASGSAATSADRAALAALLAVPGVGPLTLARVVDAIGSPAGVIRIASAPDGAASLTEAVRAADPAGRLLPADLAAAIAGAASGVDDTLADLQRLGIRIIVPADDAYPRRLHAIELPPAALFVRGSLDALARDAVVAVVGTRRPTSEGRRTAARLADALARAGATVVSGLAIGIDGAAHAAVVSAGAATVAFIGGGHARFSPRAHGRLAEAIVASGGAVVSEYAPAVEPTRGTFPQRNRLISGSADAVVVVEAGARSGALVTASWALEQGRECFLVPGSIDAPASAGCNGFLRDWPGLARIVSGLPQLLDDLGLAASVALPRHATGRVAGGARASVERASTNAVLQLLGDGDRLVAQGIVHGAVTADELVAVTRLPIGAVLGALTRLETAGLVEAAHGRYEAAGPLASVPPDRRPGRRSIARGNARGSAGDRVVSSAASSGRSSIS